MTALNPGGTCLLMQTGYKDHNPDPPFCWVSDVVFKQVNSRHDLGVIANHSLSWSDTICIPAVFEPY